MIPSEGCVDQHLPPPHSPGIVFPASRLLLLASWDEAARKIEFLGCGEKAVRPLVGRLGQLERQRMGSESVYRLIVSRLYSFEAVLAYLKVLAGADGVLAEW